MTAFTFVSVSAVRDYLALNDPNSTSSKYSDATIGSNIRAASWFLERASGRYFGNRTATTLTFTTNGQAYLVIPGLRTATSVTLQGAALTANSTYWLIADSQQTGVSTGIQFRAFRTREGGPWWLSNPQWFDRNLDSPFYPGNYGPYTSLPNDLVIAGDWGYADPLPEPVLHATKVLAAYYTKRPDALLSGAITTPEGGIFDLTQIPIEVRLFIEDWRTAPFVQAA